MALKVGFEAVKPDLAVKNQARGSAASGGGCWTREEVRAPSAKPEEAVGGPSQYGSWSAMVRTKKLVLLYS